MNNVAYTEEENELFELLESLRKIYKTIPVKNDNDKKELAEIIYHYKEFEDGIKGFAERRYEMQIVKENEIKNRMFQVIDSICEHCKQVNSQKPLREETGKMELTYFVFKCKKCNREYNSQPNTPEGYIKWNEHVLKIMLTPNADGGNYAHKAKITPEQINEYKKEIDNVKALFKKHKEEEEVLRVNNENVAILVRDSIIQYTLDKHKMLSGNNTIGES